MRIARYGRYAEKVTLEQKEPVRAGDGLNGGDKLYH